jgi:hypothetical protein
MPTTEIRDELLGFLRRLTEMIATSHSHPGDLKYVSYYAALLDLGDGKPGSRRPQGVRKQRDRQCYQNSWHAARHHGWAYCEGYDLEASGESLLLGDDHPQSDGHAVDAAPRGLRSAGVGLSARRSAAPVRGTDPARWSARERGGQEAAVSCVGRQNAGPGWSSSSCSAGICSGTCRSKP